MDKKSSGKHIHRILYANVLRFIKARLQDTPGPSVWGRRVKKYENKPKITLFGYGLCALHNLVVYRHTVTRRKKDVD